MSLLVPLDCLQLMFDLFCFFIVDPDDIVLTCSTEATGVLAIIKGHDVVTFLEVVIDLLPCLRRELVQMPISVGNKQH